MKREVQDRKRELYKQSKVLREIAIDKQPLDKQKELREQQNDAYHRLQFISNLEKAMRGNNG